MGDSPRDRVQMTETCSHCGAPRAGPGRFCAQCGAEAFTLPAGTAADAAGQHASRPQPTPRRAAPQEVLIPEAWPEVDVPPPSSGRRRFTWLLGAALLVIAAGVLFAMRSGARASRMVPPQQSGAVMAIADSIRTLPDSSSRALPGSSSASTDPEHGQVAAPAAPLDTTPATLGAPKSVHTEEPRTSRKVPTRVAPEPHVPPVTPVVLTCQSAYAQRNWARAASLCVADAERGNTSAARLVGVMYDQGHGVPRDAAQAAAWYRRAALLGDAGAQLALGHAYGRGAGVPQDLGEAFAWLSKAAAQGDAQAQYDVGIMYAAGRGTAQSDTDAVRWLRKAAAQGLRDATRELERRGIAP